MEIQRKIIWRKFEEAYIQIHGPSIEERVARCFLLIYSVLWAREEKKYFLWIAKDFLKVVNRDVEEMFIFFMLKIWQINGLADRQQDVRISD